MAVEIDPHTGPIQARGDLFDMRRFAGAVQALHHHAPVAREACQDRKRDFLVEAVCGIDVGYMVVSLAERRHHQIRVDAELLAHRNHAIGRLLRTIRRHNLPPFDCIGRTQTRGD